MNRIQFCTLMILICASNVISAMEEEEIAPASPISSYTAVTSSSSSSTSAPITPKAALKPILKNPEQEKGPKKSLRYAPEAQEYNEDTAKYNAEGKREVSELTAAQQAPFRGQEAAIEKEQALLKRQSRAVIEEEKALEILIDYAKTTLPEVRTIIDSCAQDLFEIWQFFCIVPTSAEMAKKNNENLSLHVKHYERNVLTKTSKDTEKDTDPLLDAYATMLKDYKHDAMYESGSNSTVEELYDLLSSDLRAQIREKAVTLYAPIKKARLDKDFKKIPSDPMFSDTQKYHTALHHGRTFLQDSRDILNKVDQTMRSYRIKGYPPHDYETYLERKIIVERALVADRIMPYAQKAEQEVNATKKPNEPKIIIDRSSVEAALY